LLQCNEFNAPEDDRCMNDRSRALSFVIVGRSQAGQIFRPSDWAERLCGVMSGFRPAAATGRQTHLSYSPYVMPGQRGEAKCVIVDGRIHQIEPLAYKFLMGFAQDNDLIVEYALGHAPQPVVNPG
jgi:hypothetical protein